MRFNKPMSMSMLRAQYTCISCVCGSPNSYICTGGTCIYWPDGYQMPFYGI